MVAIELVRMLLRVFRFCQQDVRSSGVAYGVHG